MIATQFIVEYMELEIVPGAGAMERDLGQDRAAVKRMVQHAEFK
jgi:hypothetical protein